jgi:Amt family ammonium transporter
MSVIAEKRKRLSLSQKFSRLAGRLRDREWRKYGGALFAGKIQGVGLVLLVMMVVSGLFFTHVYAQTATPEVKAADVVNPVNTAWTLIAAFLVFGMQVGFTMRKRASVAPAKP